MKVKCINIYDTFDKKFVETSRWLTKGKEYIVIDMEIDPKNDIYYRLLDNDPDGQPALYNASQFKVVSNVIPSNWRVTQYETGAITFSPLAWEVLGFLGRFL